MNTEKDVMKASTPGRSRRPAGMRRAGVRERMSPGEMLRTIRELQEMTQAELSKRSGVPQANISALETGVRQMGRERALTLAAALSVHPAVLLFPDYDSRDLLGPVTKAS